MQALAVDTNWHQQVIMQNAELDGQGLSTHRFRSAQKPAELIARLRERWRARSLPYVESSQGGWTIISVREHGAITTVQVRASAQGSEGMSSRWAHALAPQPKGRRGAVAPLAQQIAALLPTGSTLVRTMGHHDGGVPAVTLVAVSAEAPRSLSARLQTQARKSGYSVAGRMADQILTLRRERAELVATVTAHEQGSAVVVYGSLLP